MEIFKSPIPEITPDDIDRVSIELDAKSRAIISYTKKNRFATIEELATLCNSPNHMEILIKIREVINPAAEKIIGQPILTFEKSKIDPETGRKILYSWWLRGRDRLSEKRATFFDLFDEGDYMRVTMELTGINERNIQLHVVKNKLIINSNSLKRKIHEEIFLPPPVNPKKISKKYKNGILEVKLQKT